MEAVGAGWDGGTLQQDEGTSNTLPWDCVLPSVSFPISVWTRQGLSHTREWRQQRLRAERLQMGMFLLSQVSLGNASILGILRLLKEVIPGPGRAPVTFHLGAKMQN